MNLSAIKDYFTYQSNAQQQRNKNISAFFQRFSKITVFSLFKQVALGSVPQLNSLHIKKYMSQFTINLQVIDPNQINQLSTSKDFGIRNALSNDQILEKGIKLFLNFWGNSRKQFSFNEFSKFMRNEECSPEITQQVPYPAKKKLFQIFQAQIQNLLNIESLRLVCVKEYNNLADLFETLASRQEHRINKKSLKNLYLMHSERLSEVFFERIQKRLRLPLDLEGFLQILKRDQNQVNPKVKQRKIYYSSARKKKNLQNDDYFDEDNMSNVSNDKRSGILQTPQTQKIAFNRAITSTKLTKGEKICQIKQAPVSVGRFKIAQTPQKINKFETQKFLSNQIQILGEILAIEKAFIQLKRNLCLRKDFDLQLVYEREMEKFHYVLNQVYGNCNFTSFVRFIVPQDFQHRYLSFVRYHGSNILSNETVLMVQELFEAYQKKQNQISQLWSKIDRQMIFRMYCNPCEDSIKAEELNKYFTEVECKVLLDRMDPLKTGQIPYENFK